MYSFQMLMTDILTGANEAQRLAESLHDWFAQIYAPFVILL